MAMKKQVKARIAALVLVVPLAWCLGPEAGAQSPGPTAQEILKEVRLNQSEQHRVLSGRLRTGDLIVPFRLLLNGAEIRYEFTKPDLALVLRLGEKGSRLEEVTRSGSEKITAASFDTKVRNTDISYEDIALRFLYWTDAKIEVDDDTMLYRKCWRLRLTAPSRTDSQYSAVVLWVEKQNGAFLRADGYDWNGKLAKRFDVRSVQKVDGVWLLKQMRIERFEDGKSRDKTPTYLEIQGMEK